MNLFAESSQFKNWQYSPVKIQEINKKLFKSYNTDETVKFSQDITTCVEKINKVINIYSNYISSECIKHDLPKSIEGSALIYFKRYYLNKTIIFHAPRQMALTCIYLACKDERSENSIYSLAEKLKQNPSNSHLAHYGSEKYGALEADLLKVLDFELIVHSVFPPLDYLKKSFVTLFEKYGPTFRSMLSFKARCSFHNQWIFLYPPGILAFGVFKAALEEIGEKNVDEDFFKKNEDVKEIWAQSSEKVEEFLTLFRGYKFEHDKEKKESDSIIALSLKIKSSRDHHSHQNAFQKPLERGNITKNLSRTQSIDKTEKRKLEKPENNEAEPPLEKKMKPND